MKKIISITLAAVMLLTSLGLFTLAGSAADANIRRITAVMNGDAKSARGLGWTTDTDAKAIAKVVKASDFTPEFTGALVFNGTCEKFEGVYSNKVMVTGLEAGTAYNYIVGDGTNWSEVGTFETAADGNDDFSFITIADVQASNDENFARAAKVVGAAIDKLPDYKFMVNLGDFVNDCTQEEWDFYAKNFDSINLGTTLVPVSGNHEGNMKWGWFQSVFNTRKIQNLTNKTGSYYSFDYGNVHAAVLNTNDMYPMSLNQINWLKNDMSKSDADWKVIFMHRALYSAGKNINKPDTLIMRNVLLPVIDELGIDIVMAGHDHMYFRTEQVKGDALVEDVATVTELYNGEATEFAYNPDGTSFILPSTAGTKRYDVNDKAVEPILSLAAKSVATKEYGVYSTINIDVDEASGTTKFVYNAYGLNEETGVSTLIDSYAIMKDMGQTVVDPNYEELKEIGNEGFDIMRMFREFANYFVKDFVRSIAGIVNYF